MESITEPTYFSHMTGAPSGVDAPPERTFSLEGGLSGSMLVGIGIALAVEGVAIHLWVASRTRIVAWLITLLNVASLAYLWRAYVGAQRAVLRINASEVELDMGQVRCRFPRSAIESVEPATWRSVPDVPKAFLDSAKPLDPNVLIAFRQPVIMHAPLGITRQITRLTLRAKDPHGVIATLCH